MPDTPAWSDTKSGYLLFIEGYSHALKQAQKAGWPTRTLHAGHFHMLVDPAVATALVELLRELDEKP